MFKKEKQDTEHLSAESLYGTAKDLLLRDKWAEALEQLKALEARYPYGRFAKQAQLDTAFAHYKNGDDGLAIAASDRFIGLNPAHPAVDYAYYIKGLASFNEVPGFRGLMTGRNNLAKRDPKSITDALAAFKTVVQRFPNSPYKRDAQKRINYLESARAQHEISIARFYFDRGAYVAAVNRSKIVLALYTNLPEAEDALGILFLSYQNMQLTDLAEDTQRVLSLNYPQSAYLKTNANAKLKLGLLGRLFK